MRRRRNPSDARTAETLDFLRGLKSVPSNVARRRLAAVKERLTERAQTQSVIQRQASSAWRALRTPAADVAGASRAAARAVDGLRAVTDALSKRKVAVPPTRRAISGLGGATMAATFAAPFDFASDFAVVAIGSADVSSSSNKLTGDMSIEVATQGVKTDQFSHPQAGLAQAEMGVFFRPPFPRAMLRISASPSFSFAWWINSVLDDGITSAEVAISISGFKGTDTHVDGSAFEQKAIWSHTKAFIVDFEIGSEAAFPLATQLEVDSAHFYALTVSTECFAEGFAWPGSLAGAHVVMKLPFISMEIEQLPPIVDTNA